MSTHTRDITGLTHLGCVIEIGISLEFRLPLVSRMEKEALCISLILLGWELRASYITVLGAQTIPILLSPLLFMPSLYSTF